MAASLTEEQTKKILRQVEFYFGDSNLPKDTFLKKTYDESEDGFVSLALICSFTKMKGHLGLGTEKDVAIPEETVLAVAEVLRQSSFLKVSEDGKKVGRKTGLPKPEVIEQVDSRTIAASPLPYDVTREDLEAFFGEQAKVNSVRLPRIFADKKAFCGTALIEFAEEETAINILGKSLIFAGADLNMKPKKDFDSEREKQLEEFEKNRPEQTDSSRSFPKGVIVSFKLKSISEVDKTEKVSEAVKKETESEKIVEDAKDDAAVKKENPSEDAEMMNVEPDTDTKDTEEKKPTVDDKDVVRREDLKNVLQKPTEAKDTEEKKPTVDDKDVVRREDLKNVLQKFGNIKYIDFKMGDDSGYIRFEDPDSASKARAAAILTDEGGFIVKKFIATFEPVSGDEEKEYWSKLQDDQVRNRNGFRGRGRNNRGRGRFDGKRNRGDSGNGRPYKTQRSNGDN